MMSDYSQIGDPYGINDEYTAQSAHEGIRTKQSESSAHDVRGNTVSQPRGIPTQAEADAIMKGMK